MPRFRMGLMIGLAVGYYQGTKAGRARYEQLRTYVDKVSQTDAVETAREKAKAVIDLSVERAKDFTGADGGDGTTTATTTTTTGLVGADGEHTILDDRLTTSGTPTGYSSSR